MTSGIKALGGTFGNVAAGGLKIFAAGVTAAATGVAALGASAIKSYAEYEQLAGGIETLFGARGAKSVEEYADLVGQSVESVSAEFDMLQQAQSKAMQDASEAYKTAGMSANEYMETISGFAASLKQSTESELEAAEVANMAVTDMSDNANKMGTSMELIQNAYQGFAKQNYTMLDNLKLGYGGTKSEMERLLADATALSGIEYDINSLSDVYSAIHVIQTELGITGTTAKEASTTISGSLNMTKAAWSNLLTGIADDNADFDTLVENFVESVAVAAGNLLPRVEVALGGIGQLIETLLPVIVAKIPELINNGIPNLLETGASLITTLLDGIQQNLPQIVQGVVNIANQFVTTFTSMMPQILQMGLQIIANLAIGIGQALPTLIPTIVNVLLEMVDTLIDNIDMILDAAMQLIEGLAEGIITALPVLIEKVPEIIIKLVEALIENLPKLLEFAAKMVTTLADAILENWPKLIQSLPELVMKIVGTLIENAPKLGKAALQFVLHLAKTIVEFWPKLLSEIPKIVTNLVNSFLALVGKIGDVGGRYVDSIKEAISTKWNEIVSSVGGWVGNLINGFFAQVAEFTRIGASIVEGIKKGITDTWGDLTKTASSLASSLVTTTKKTLDINSPSKKFKYLGEMCVAGLDEPLAEYNPYDTVGKTFKASPYALSSNFAGTVSKSYVGAPIVNYDKMAGAFLTAFEHAGFKVAIGQRELGRIVREVIA